MSLWEHCQDLTGTIASSVASRLPPWQLSALVHISWKNLSDFGRLLNEAFQVV